MGAAIKIASLFCFCDYWDPRLLRVVECQPAEQNELLIDVLDSFLFEYMSPYRQFFYLDRNDRVLRFGAIQSIAIWLSVVRFNFDRLLFDQIAPSSGSDYKNISVYLDNVNPFAFGYIGRAFREKELISALLEK